MSGCVGVEPESEESSSEAEPEISEPEISEPEISALAQSEVTVACSGDTCIIICGGGGSCEKVGSSTWACGC